MGTTIKVTDLEYKEAKKLQKEMSELGVKMPLKECYTELNNMKIQKKAMRFGRII